MRSGTEAMVSARIRAKPAFQAKASGSTLVISSAREIRYIHHYYYLDRICITVPDGISVVKENIKLTGERPPDPSATAP